MQFPLQAASTLHAAEELHVWRAMVAASRLSEGGLKHDETTKYGSQHPLKSHQIKGNYHPNVTKRTLESRPH